jgi:TPR repeat protein
MANTDALLRIAHNAWEKGDLDHARQCLERGAALGDAEALQGLGFMYDVGEGVPVDKIRAMKLYRRAWRCGSHAAANNIAILYREQGRSRTMFQWFERVARAGDGSAQLELAKCYLSGIGVRRNFEAAIRCLAVASTSVYISEHDREEALGLMSGLKPRIV